MVVVLGWGRTAVVSERSSREMAGQQLPSASDQGARRLWPRANGALLPLSSKIVDVGAVLCHPRAAAGECTPASA